MSWAVAAILVGRHRPRTHHRDRRFLPARSGIACSSG
jgi:hypothetical protein